MFSGSGKGGFAPGELVRNVGSDRFHVEEMRRRALAERAQHDAEDFVNEFQSTADGALELEQFYGSRGGRMRQQPPRDLDAAFAAFLRDGHVADDLHARAMGLPKQVLAAAAMNSVMATFPGMPPAMVEQRAIAMLHDLDLDDCHGRPHPAAEWVDEFHHAMPDHHHHHGGRQRGADWANEMHANEWADQMHMGHAPHAEEWAHEMRLDDAYDAKRHSEKWASDYNEAEFAQLDKAYEAEKWADEHLRDEAQRAQKQDSDPWFEQFLQRENQLKESSLKQITARLTAIDDPKLQQSQFMSFVRDLDSGRSVIHGDKLVRNEGEAWADEMATSKGETTSDFMERMYQDTNFDGFDWASRRDANFAFESVEDGYRFEQSPEANPFSEEANPLQKGIELFRDGRFTDAILAFEAAVKRDEGNSKAWHYLGKCHQEGDKDSQAIAALQRAVETDPSALEAFVDLAVSHTNNMQKDRAMLALEGWLRNNPRYANLAPPPLHEAGRGGEDVEAQLRAMYERQDVLIDCFVEAAQTSPNAVDPAVQVCLGLLYSLALEYDNAAQCFSAALSKLPDDYALWNKLGATLANSGRSEEALQAYFQALERKPLYVRARANLGISFMAMKLYPEAAKQFLSALSIEPDASHIWSNLETVFSYLQRPDLLSKSKSRRVADFRGDFDF